MNLIAKLAILLLISNAMASHFRGGTISFTRSPGSTTVTFKVTTHWFTGGITPRARDYSIDFGDGDSFAPSFFDVDEVDGSGLIHTLIYTAVHTYPSLSAYVATVGDCCRQNKVINGNRDFIVTAGVALNEPICLGNADAIVPGRQELPISEAATFGISPSTPNGDDLLYSFYDGSGLWTNPPISAEYAATVVPRNPASKGVDVVWNTQYALLGQLFAVSVRADIQGSENCWAVWDIAIEIVESEPPSCTLGDGAVAVGVADDVYIEYAAVHPKDAPMTITLVGAVPEGAVFSANTPSVTWDGPLAPGSYSWAVQFCDEGNSCGACSTSLVVNDEIPNMALDANVTPLNNGAIGDTFIFELQVTNTSPKGAEEDPIQLSSMVSDVFGDVTQIPGSTCELVLLDTSEPYVCTFSTVVNEPGTIVTVFKGSDDEGTSADAAVDLTPIDPDNIPTDNGATVKKDDTCQPIGTLCTTDADCGTVDQVGLCYSGVCQCGFGWQGILASIDPTGCEAVCVPPTIPDAYEFLIEPTIAMGAYDATFQMNVTIDAYSKQTPATIAFLNPDTWLRCGILPDLLGQCKIEQLVDPNTCDNIYIYRNNFADEMLRSDCWEELASFTETGPDYQVEYRSWHTVLEVVNEGVGPFAQIGGGTLQDTETDITRIFRRPYIIELATVFRIQSETFNTVVGPDPFLFYRLVVIDYDLFRDVIRVVVETRVPDGGRLHDSFFDIQQSSVSAHLEQDVQFTGCQAGAPAGICQQFHTFELGIDPCKVLNEEAVLQVQLGCAGTESDPSTCGFTNLPPNNMYVLDDLILDYDACPRVIQYAIDSGASNLDLYQDSARSTLITADAITGDVIYGQVNLVAAGDAVLQEATLTELHVYQVSSPNNIDFGDQLSSTYVTLLSSQTAVSATPLWNFDLYIDPAVFVQTETYFLEAFFDVTFANTGTLTKRRVHLKIPSLNRREQSDTVEQQENIFSATFKAPESKVGREQHKNTSSSNSTLLAIAGAGGALVVIVVVVVIVILVLKKNKNTQHSSGVLPMEITSSSITSSTDSL